MSTGIGFSVGDIFAGIQLIRDITAALNDSHGASAEYRALITELYALERCLIEVKNLQLDDSQQAQISAIRAAACQCQRTLDGFGKKIRKYQPHLRAGGSGSLIRDSWKKVQWSLCEKNDIDQLKADLRGHTGSLEVLLMTVQMDSTTINFRKQEEQSKTILRRMQEASFSVLGALKTIKKNVTHLLDRTARILRTNLLIYKTVLEMHNILTRIPGQIESGQLVYLLDARNRPARIPLETIQTKEAFIYVLKNLFRDRGARKIEREEFVLEVRGRNQPIRLRDPWENWFSPGERVDMSMTFPDVVSSTSTCPACQCHYDKPTDVDIECSNCGTTFRRVTDLLDHANSHNTLNGDEISGMSSEKISIRDGFGPRRPTAPLRRKRGREEERLENEDLRHFKRVRILAGDPACALDENLLPEKVEMFWTEWPDDEKEYSSINGNPEPVEGKVNSPLTDTSPRQFSPALMQMSSHSAGTRYSAAPNTTKASGNRKPRRKEEGWKDYRYTPEQVDVLISQHLTRTIRKSLGMDDEAFFLTHTAGLTT